MPLVACAKKAPPTAGGVGGLETLKAQLRGQALKSASWAGPQVEVRLGPHHGLRRESLVASVYLVVVSELHLQTNPSPTECPLSASHCEPMASLEVHPPHTPNHLPITVLAKTIYKHTSSVFCCFGLLICLKTVLDVSHVNECLPASGYVHPVPVIPTEARRGRQIP